VNGPSLRDWSDVDTWLAKAAGVLEDWNRVVAEHAREITVARVGAP